MHAGREKFFGLLPDTCEYLVAVYPFATIQRSQPAVYLCSKET
jgi:hypothetical protein